jgi:hypothetical protein
MRAPRSFPTSTPSPSSASSPATSMPSTENSPADRSASSPSRAATVSRRRVQLSAQHRSRCAQLLFPTRGAFRQNQFGGTFGGPHSPRQGLLLRGLSGNAPDAGHRYGRNLSVPSRRRTCRQSFRSLNWPEPTYGMRKRALSGRHAFKGPGLQCGPNDPYYRSRPVARPAVAAVFPTGPFRRAPGPFQRSVCSNTFRPPTLPMALPPLPITRLYTTTRKPCASMRTPAGPCFRPITSSTDSR